MTVLINLIGISLIIGIIWWFWLSQSFSIPIMQENKILIKVKDGVYQPSNITVPANAQFILQFLREDSTPCSEYIIFDSLKISQQLPLNQLVDVSLTLKPGEYEFTCQMRMYRGKLIAK